MTSYTEKFQQLLRELFQFDCADLDFGIYRIMNYKRDVIEKFITQDLPKAIAEELDHGALADQSQAAKELIEVAQKIKETLGKDALDADGNLAEAYHGTPLGKKYQDLKSKATGGRGREALEASIFNHLYAFFSRYYQDGDFISKRRYSKRQRYAIPYNGEEVYLYWANSDQYYVKTAEHFHDYNFTSRGVTVHFKLQAASVEQNNVKGDKRFFLPRTKEKAWDEDTGQLVVPFEYRPLTEQEEITYGRKNQQDAIIAEAMTEIPKRLSPKNAGQALAALTVEKRKTAEGESISFLEHHLRQYTRRNTSDFFIHKDLKGFLSRELDFYLKNEVLNLDEMETAGEDRAEAWFQITRSIKAVGGRIIDFLDQIECFQKMLWEKRKFITETQYCVTIGNVDESFYPKNSAGEDSCWRWSSKKVEVASHDNDQILIAKQNRSGEWRVFEKSRKSLKAPKSIWFDTGVINEKGTMEVGSLGLKNFGFPKPLELLKLVARIGSCETDILLDFFAGSGTTGHAVINLNREDEGERKFILVEMGQYFDTVLLPRIKKVTFTPEWKDGKPERMATEEEFARGPHVVKYLSLESYEDALNNIGFDDASGQQALEFEDYLLKYMLKWETRASETLLNVEKLARPFNYKLHIHVEGQTCVKVADVPETFNYLLGLNVQTRRVYDDNGRRYLVYRGRIDHRQIVVIWPETEGWQKADLERDKKFVATQKLTEGADEVFINGDSFIPNARALEPVFKARMFAPVEV